MRHLGQRVRQGSGRVCCYYSRGLGPRPSGGLNSYSLQDHMTFKEGVGVPTLPPPPSPFSEQALLLRA